MSDSLRDRIAAAAAYELVRQSRDAGEYQTRDCFKVADAVIAALGLQPHLAKRIINGKPDQWVRRHTTDWEIVDD